VRRRKRGVRGRLAFQILKEPFLDVTQCDGFLAPFKAPKARYGLKSRLIKRWFRIRIIARDRYHQCYCNQREGLHHGMTMLKNEDIIEMDLDLDNGQL
jgi:hypothetical protein